MNAKTPFARMFAAVSALAFAAVMVLSGCPSKTTGPAGATTTPKDKPAVTKPAGKTDTMATDKKGAGDPTTPKPDGGVDATVDKGPSPDLAKDTGGDAPKLESNYGEGCNDKSDCKPGSPLCIGDPANNSLNKNKRICF
jgi:hypothetical protein